MDKPEKILTIKEVEKNWNAMAEIYHQFDSAPQSFYFAIVNILQLQKAKNVLEVGCGRCTLVPYSLGILKPEATYLATDLAPKMIQHAEQKLKQTLSRFSCGISFQQWCKKNNITFKVANGEEIIEPNLKFDRIICNMVLMLTQNPQKMLKSFYQQAQQGCLLGIAVWGQKQFNTFHQQMQRIVDQLKVERPKARSNFHLYNRVAELGQKQGWKLVVTWEQISSVPYLDVDSFGWYAKQMSSRMTYLTEEKRKWVEEEFMKRQKERLYVRKQAFLFPAQIIILRK